LKIEEAEIETRKKSVRDLMKAKNNLHNTLKSRRKKEGIDSKNHISDCQ
jgi:hypothetical protein